MLGIAAVFLTLRLETRVQDTGNHIAFQVQQATLPRGCLIAEMQAETRRDPVEQFEIQTGAVTVLPWPDIFAFVAERQLPFSAAVAFTAASSIQASQRRRLPNKRRADGRPMRRR